MKILFSWIGIVAGLVAIVFNKPLARRIMRYYPEGERPRWLKIMRIAYLLIGSWMVLIGIWALLKQIW